MTRGEKAPTEEHCFRSEQTESTTSRCDMGSQAPRCRRAPEWPLPESTSPSSRMAVARELRKTPPHHEKTSMTQHRTAVWCLLQDSLLYFARKLRPAARRPQRTRQPGTPHGPSAPNPGSAPCNFLPHLIRFSSEHSSKTGAPLS